MLALAAALLLAAVPATLTAGERLPPLTLVDQNDATVRLDALGGRKVLLSFVSTRQATATYCPAVTAKFLYLQQHLPSGDYRLVQITRDAPSDSPPRLREYADRFGARAADWRFLTGSPATVARLIASLGAGSAANGYEKLYALSGDGVLLGELPSVDWSPIDALAWAADVPRGSTYLGVSATAHAPLVQARLELRGPSLRRQLDLVEFDKSPANPIRSYVRDMTKLLHLIAVSDDLRDFQHVHPQLGPDGHFRMTLDFPRSGVYHIYADATPRGRSNAVFRFDAPIGEPGSGARPNSASSDETTAGPYTVKLSAVRIPANQDVPLLVAIQRASVPALDLHPYLGAYAHVVAIGVSDLTYLHVHPTMPGAMDMSGSGAMSESLPDSAPVPATMTVHLTLPRRGLYKIWIQFKGGAALYAAPFVVLAT